MIVGLMGVAGCGKTTVGQNVCSKLSWTFKDGDDLHPPANKTKMGSGIPLEDSDRWPWLAVINTEMKKRESRGEDTLFTCSALKQVYRDCASKDVDIRWVYIKVDYQLAFKRLSERKGHFMKSSLLDSQFAILEEPKDPSTITITDTGYTAGIIANFIVRELQTVQAV